MSLAQRLLIEHPRKTVNLLFAITKISCGSVGYCEGTAKLLCEKVPTQIIHEQSKTIQHRITTQVQRGRIRSL